MGKIDSDELWVGFLGGLNEVHAQQLAGLKALEFGQGGISKVGRLTGMDYKTMKKVKRFQKKGRQCYIQNDTKDIQIGTTQSNLKKLKIRICFAVAPKL